jgi:hypothetical protein
MTARGKTLGALIAAASVAGVVLWRRSGRRKERADLYFADGSMVTFEQGSLAAGQLVPLAREIVATGRGRG